MPHGGYDETVLDKYSLFSAEVRRQLFVIDVIPPVSIVDFLHSSLFDWMRQHESTTRIDTR